jgi:hypothetical protein
VWNRPKSEYTTGKASGSTLQALCVASRGRVPVQSCHLLVDMPA